MANYRWIGNKDKWDGTSRIVVKSNGSEVYLNIGGVVDLTPQELDSIDDRFLFALESDPVTSSPILEDVYVARGTNDLYSESGSMLSVESSDAVKASVRRLSALRARDAFPAVMATPPTLAYVSPSGTNPITSSTRRTCARRLRRSWRTG